MIPLLLALLGAAPQATAPQDPTPVATEAPALAQEGPSIVEETQLDRDTRRLAAELRCPVCQGLSLEDSPSELSQEMRHIIKEQLEAGKSVEEVKAYFVEKYGEWILLEPEPHGLNLAIYFLPVILVLGGAFFLYRIARKWTKQGSTVAEDADEPANVG